MGKKDWRRLVETEGEWFSDLDYNSRIPAGCVEVKDVAIGAGDLGLTPQYCVATAAMLFFFLEKCGPAVKPLR